MGKGPEQTFLQRRYTNITEPLHLQFTVILSVPLPVIYGA